MRPSRSYQEYLIKSLKDPEEAVGYLNAALEEKDTKLFLLALRNVAEAHGGLKMLSRKAHLNRENLYRMLSLKGNPEIASLEAVLEALGLQFIVQFKSKPKPHKSKPHHRAA